MAAKQYIVTFKSESVDQATVAKVLSADSDKIFDGLSLMAGDTIPASTDVLSFESLGVTVASMTQSEANALKKDRAVLDVTEDIEVHALGCGGGNDLEAWFGAAYSAGFRAGSTAGGAQDREVPTAPPVTPLASGRASEIATGTSQWNIEMIRADDVWPRVTGRDVKVAVLDTGVDKDHPALTVQDGVSFVPGVSSWDDDHHHGTHCAGIIGARWNPRGVFGVAPGCDLYAVKVLNSRGSGRLSGILAGMEWAREQGMDVVSMSLGSNVSQADAACIEAYNRAAKKLIASGCIVVAAAGNSGRTSTPWVGNPARCPGFMAVAAVDRNRRIASFSSRGPDSLDPVRAVEIAAPGVSVLSTVPNGRYAELSGTSMACPHVAGAAALLCELHPNWGPETIRERLGKTASDVGVPGRDPEFGMGILDCFAAVFD
jgi:subtilisin family serine protease